MQLFLVHTSALFSKHSNNLYSQFDCAQKLGLTAEQRPVEGELLGKVLDVCDTLVHSPGEVVRMVKTAQDDAGEVDGLHEVAHQRALNAYNIPPKKHKKKKKTKLWFIGLSNIFRQYNGNSRDSDFQKKLMSFNEWYEEQTKQMVF